MIRTDVLEFGEQAYHVLHYKRGDIYAVFSNTVYLRSSRSLCCLGLTSLVNGPLNIRTRLSKLPPLNVGDSWSFQNNKLTLGSYCTCHTSDASVWIPPDKPAFAFSPFYKDCIKVIEEELLNNSSFKKAKSSLTNTLTLQHLDHYQSVLTNSLQSLDSTGIYQIPEELTGLLGCGDGLTPAGDDILLGVVVTAIHFNQPKLSEPLIKWLRQYAADRTNLISYTHLMSACDGQGIEYLHTLLNELTTIANNPRPVTTAKSKPQHTILQLLHHGESSGYYTISGVLLVLKYLDKSTLIKR